MIVYVVDLDIDAAIAGEYAIWLRSHVNEMLVLPGFLGADILERIEPAEAPDRKAFSVHYHLRDTDAFDAYLRDHAMRMREAGLQRFGERVRASRGLLKSLD